MTAFDCFVNAVAEIGYEDYWNCEMRRYLAEIEQMNRCCSVHAIEHRASVVLRVAWLECESVMLVNMDDS